MKIPHGYKVLYAVRLATIVAATLLGSTVVATSTPAFGQSTVTTDAGDCLLRESTQKLTCYPNFRAAMRAATGGKVTDAPLDAGRLDMATTKRINAAGLTAAKARAAGKSAAGDLVLGIAYKEPNFGGGTLSFLSGNSCSGGKTHLYDINLSGWDNAISSYKNITDCATNYYVDAGQVGTHHMWYSNDQNFQATADNQYSSVKFWDGPSRKELVDRCDQRAEYCRFVPKAPVTESAAGFREVARHWNCTPYENSLSVEWSDTTGGSINMGVEVSATASFGVGALANLSATISASVNREWNWESTVSRTTSLNTGPMGWAALDRSPKLQNVQGTIEMKLKDSTWGRKEWYVWGFGATVAVPGHLGVTRSRGGLMDAGQLEEFCSDPAATRTPAPTRFATRHEIAAS